MAGRRSNQGENNTDGFDYQHYTLLYCIEYLMKHKELFPGFEIGSGIEEHGALDDIVLHATLPDKSVVTNLLQVKHSNQTIHKHYLCYNNHTYVLKYFDTFIDLQTGKLGKTPILLEQLDQLIIWTNMPFANDVKDWFEVYVPTDRKRDVLGDSRNLDYQRFRFREDKYKDVSFLFHTRMKLVYEIVEGLFNQQKWKSISAAAKSYYLAMAKQIIEGNGVDMKFKDEFIKEKEDLLEEKDRFRKCFKVAMERKFIREKIEPPFSMEELNSDEYRKYFELNFDTNVQVLMRWEEWKNEKEDLEEFRKRFVFYVKVPQVDKLKTFLINQNSRFTEVSELLKRCAVKKMINKKQYENLISLIKFRQCMDLGPYDKLLFDDPNDPLPAKIKNFLTEKNSGTCLHVKAIQDLNCTVSRLISPVKDCLAPLNDRYLVLSCTTFYKSLSNFQTIIEEKSLVENGLKCLIIAAVPRGKSQEIETILSPRGVKAILVGDQLDNGFVDTFDISKLHQDCKDIINNREIYLSDLQAAKASEIFGNELFLEKNYRLALELFQRSIQLEGNELQLDEHFRERNMNVNQRKTNVLDLICRDDYQQIVLSDQAGMGKSTELINIAIEMRKTYKDHLVVCLDCKDALRHHNEKVDIAYIVCKTTSIRGRTKEAVVRKLIELGKMILLLDGIDEVSDSCTTKLEAMLNTISKAGLFKLVIATRPHRNALIQKIFDSCILCQLEPFSQSDQLDYVISFWKVKELVDENDRTRIEENAKELINKFRSMSKDGSLIGIPLQTHMIAVIYEKSIMSKDFEQPKPYKIGYIYKQFVELKFKGSFKHFDLITKAHENAIRTQWEKFLPDHITVAQKIYANAPEEELSQLCNQLQTYGLVRLHPKVAFVHHTYYEYFLSLYFLTAEETDPKQEFVSFMRQNLCASRESIVTKFMDFHFDELDPSRKLETDNSIIDCLLNDFKPLPPTVRLHPNKLREFQLYLLNHCSETERYTLIRNSFNLSVFNVFEVLYDTLPTDTKSALKFCFGKKPEPNFINLKLFGGNQVLQLLSILLVKNPENLVRLHLTDFDDNEEDFLEVACRKPFVQVLEWLVNDLIPNLNCEERIVLNSYVDRRFDRYLQLIVKHNNDQFLQGAIRRAKDLWPKSAINCFLLERNVLQAFLNTVELPSDTKPLKDEQRVEMVHHIHDLYQWAFDGQFLISDGCRETIANLQIDAIKRAFNDTFPSL